MLELLVLTRNLVKIQNKLLWISIININSLFEYLEQYYINFICKKTWFVTEIIFFLLLKSLLFSATKKKKKKKTNCHSLMVMIPVMLCSDNWIEKIRYIQSNLDFKYLDITNILSNLNFTYLDSTLNVEFTLKILKTIL